MSKNWVAIGVGTALGSLTSTFMGQQVAAIVIGVGVVVVALPNRSMGIARNVIGERFG